LLWTSHLFSKSFRARDPNKKEKKGPVLLIRRRNNITHEPQQQRLLPTAPLQTYHKTKQKPKCGRTYEKAYTGEKPKETVPHQTQQQTLSNSKNHKKKQTEKKETGDKFFFLKTTTTISYEPSNTKPTRDTTKKEKERKHSPRTEIINFT
jgi:hypothetical protein